MLEKEIEQETIIKCKDGRTIKLEGEVVKPKEFFCWNLPIWNNILRVKVNYSCRKCGVSQTTRVPIMDYPITSCNYCKTRNIFPIGID